ncbi:MAG: hypothetical protein IPH39_11775 [Sulfuritalea sp.]|nr:hypothetical protein [Sulfuritalea sp.]MBK8761013.1 hypothetical protein [Sulfuritalea sp.]
MLNLLDKLTGKNHHYIYCNPSGLARIIQRPDKIEATNSSRLTVHHFVLKHAMTNANECKYHQAARATQPPTRLAPHHTGPIDSRRAARVTSPATRPRYEALEQFDEGQCRGHGSVKAERAKPAESIMRLPESSCILISCFVVSA